jgi:anti-anti-sigma regulatory factor
MSYVIDFFQTPGTTSMHFRIRNFKKLTGMEANAIREEVKELLQTDATSIYIDAKDVLEADLSGINEIINTHYTLLQKGKNFVFVYRKDSAVEKWVEATGLYRFVNTAIVPFN